MTELGIYIEIRIYIVKWTRPVGFINVEGNFALGEFYTQFFRSSISIR